MAFISKLPPACAGMQIWFSRQLNHGARPYSWVVAMVVDHECLRPPLPERTALNSTLTMASNGGIQVLPSGAGYGIVVGIGGVFALMMLGLTWLQNRYASFSHGTIRGSCADTKTQTRFSTKQAEEFNTASRSIKPGLIASGIVSCTCGPTRRAMHTRH